MAIVATAFLALLAVGATPALGEIIAPDLRYLAAYSSDDCTGVSYEFFDYVPDVSTHGLNSSSFNSVRMAGRWIGYQSVDYYDFAWGYAAFDTCYDVSAYQIWSLRYAGSPVGIDDVYYNLYKEIEYGGIEFRGNANAEALGELDLEVSSICIMGQSPWTFYTGQGYTGTSVCVYPHYVPTSEDGMTMHYIYYSKISNLGLPDNSIRSVARGCLSATVVRGKPVDASIPPNDSGEISRAD